MRRPYHYLQMLAETAGFVTRTGASTVRGDIEAPNLLVFQAHDGAALFVGVGDANVHFGYFLNLGECQKVEELLVRFCAWGATDHLVRSTSPGGMVCWNGSRSLAPRHGLLFHESDSDELLVTGLDRNGQATNGGFQIRVSRDAAGQLADEIAHCRSVLRVEAPGTADGGAPEEVAVDSEEIFSL